MSVIDGGPAFPTTTGQRTYVYDGMTLRDYFAAKAMQAQISFTGGRYSAGSMAKSSYLMADAMIQERNKP